ncbi:MAG TPA: hypothetical protein VFE65_03140 [Pseudonocardia sp.]|nr:hypothetical protein [Pseudonocardia sp.]
MISLLAWLQGLLADPDARAAFFSDPDGFTDGAGFDHLTAADFHDALVLVSDTAPISYDDRFSDQFGSLFHHIPVEAGELADQSAGDYLRDYLATSHPAEADSGHSFSDSSDNDPLAHLAHDGWTGAEPGTDHAIGTSFGTDADDPGFGAGFNGHSEHDPGFASGDHSDTPPHPSEVTAASQLGHDAWLAHDLTHDPTHDGAGYESMFGDDLRTAADHADSSDQSGHSDHRDHSEHEADHPPL